MSVVDRQIYELPLKVLAKWLANQDNESWWSVDGEPELEGSVGFPTLGTLLADRLLSERPDRTVLFLAAKSENKGICSAEEFDALVSDDGSGSRVLQLSWSRGGPEWLVIEDREIVGATGEFDDDEAEGPTGPDIAGDAAQTLPA